MSILEINHLSVEYHRDKKIVQALRDVSLNVRKGETLSIVGESGSGKSTLAQSILNLISPEDGEIISGEVVYDNRNIIKYLPTDMQKIRGKEISIIFQDPYSSLNPVLTIGDQIKEAYSAHNPDADDEDAISKAHDSLEEVRFRDQERIFNAYPHQLSGGEKQRACLAMAIINRPKILIADEPTTALDVTIQREILNLIDRLKRELSLTVIFITHNLGLAFQRSQRIAIMYGGDIVEIGRKDDIFTKPLHPYTNALIQSIPDLNKQIPKSILTGQVPDMSNLPTGCKFNPRCRRAMKMCIEEEPFGYNVDNSTVKCFIYENDNINSK
ncbi:ABC transporter ATP-binding protein [Elusimicrobiota bacterium]